MADERPLRVLIVDDEAPARRLLDRYVAAHPGLQAVGEAGDGAAAAVLIQQVTPDLVLLDIEMPGEDGFRLLEHLAALGVAVPQVVFVTAFDRYAVRAFEVHAVDYLLKPVVPARFNAAIDRCLRRRRDGGVTDTVPVLADVMRLPPTRLLAQERGRIVPVPLEAITWIEAEGDYVRIHARDRTHLIERTLTEMARILAPLGFRRVHRSAIVNMRAVKELVPEGSGRYRLLLAGGETVSVSRSHGSQFRSPTI